MKTILLFLLLLFLIALPAFGELTTQDLEKIRQIVKESETAIMSDIEKINSKIDTIDTRLRTVETGVAELRGRSIAISPIKDWGLAFCALGALIVSIIALRRAQSTIRQTPQDTPKAASQ